MKVRWYHPFRALREILRNQEIIIRNQAELLRLGEFERAVRRLHMHGVEMPPDVASYWFGRFEICRVRLGDLKCSSPSLGVVSFSDSYLYTFLKTGDREVFKRYRDDISRMSGIELDYSGRDEEFSQFAKQVAQDGYDISRCAIVVRANDNVVIDGNHRVAALLYAYGAAYEVKVIKLFPRGR